MNRVIKFRGKVAPNGRRWLHGYYYVNKHGQHLIYNNEECYEVLPESLGQFIECDYFDGLTFYEGDIIFFWLCYSTTQTHTGDNIPNGSYTEPDEPQLIKIKAQIIYDETRAKFTWSIIGTVPYSFSEHHQFYSPDTVPLLDREYYNEGYIRWQLGYKDAEFANEAEELEYAEFILEKTGMHPTEFYKVCNSIEIIGNIYENPELLKS